MNNADIEIMFHLRYEFAFKLVNVYNGGHATGHQWELSRWSRLLWRIDGCNKTAFRLFGGGHSETEHK